MEIGTMVLVSKKARHVARGKAGWISGFTRNNQFAQIELRGGETVEVNMKHLTLASKGFNWPRGPQAELVVYGEDDPQRIPAEGYFSERVQSNINDARTNTGTGYINLWQLIESLKDLADPKRTNSGFHSWLGAIEGILGADSCRKVGETVCRLMNFTIEEGESLAELPRKYEATEYGLPDTATWEDIREARERQHRLHRENRETELASVTSDIEGVNLSDLSDEDKWSLFVEKAFAAAGLPEVDESQLEAGTYTNAQIAEKLRGNPLRLTALLMGVSDMGSEAEKRSIISFAVDMVDDDSSPTE